MRANYVRSETLQTNLRIKLDTTHGLYRVYYTASNFLAGIARGLRCEIIRIAVNHHSFSYHIGNLKTICKNRQECTAIAFK